MVDIEETLRSTLDVCFESKHGKIPYADIIPELYVHTYEGARISSKELQLGVCYINTLLLID
jgi:hypothetical protein